MDLVLELFMLQGIQGHLVVLSVITLFTYAWHFCHGDGSRQEGIGINDAPYSRRQKGRYEYDILNQ
jgi:hypothetical protein